MKDRVGDALVGLFLWGIAATVAVSFPWTALPMLVIWVAVNERRIKLHRTANPAPPPGREGAVETNPQVTYWGNGAGMTIMPADHQGRHDV